MNKIEQIYQDIKSGFLKSQKDYFVLLLLILLIFVINIVWLRIDTLTPHWDMARHLEVSNNYLLLINKSITGDFEAFKDIFGTYQYYPPFYYWLAALWYKVFGNSADIAAMMNIIPLIIVVFSVYGIGKKIWDRKVGLLSAIIVVSIPIFISQMKEFQLDFPAAAFTALAFYLLLITDDFKNLKYSALFGVVCGIGMLTKWPFMLFMLGPLLVIITKIVFSKIALYRQKKKIDFLEFRNLTVVFLLFFLIAGPWYIHNFAALKRDFFGNIDIGSAEGDPRVYSWGSIQYYFWAILNGQLYLVLFLPFLIGFIYSFFNKEVFKKNFLILVMIATAYIGFTLFKNKDIRFIVPILPCAIILLSYWVFMIRNKFFRYVLIFYYCMVSLFLILSINFGIKLLPHEFSFAINKDKRVIVYAQHGYIIGQPIVQDWQVEKIVKLIERDRIRNFSEDEFINIYLYIDDEMRFNTWDFRYYSVLHKLPNAIHNIGFPPNYYVISSKDNLDNFLAQAREYAKVNNQRLYLLYDSVLPNQNKVYVYRIENND